MTANFLYPTTNNLPNETERPYNPIVPITLGHAQFSGPLEVLCKVNDLLEIIQTIDSLYHEQDFYDCKEELYQEQLAVTCTYPCLRAQLRLLCSPMQLQYIDTLTFYVTQDPEWDCGDHIPLSNK